MTSDDLRAQTAKFFKESWKERPGKVVPTYETVQMGNDAVRLDAAVLYADMAGSTTLVDTHSAQLAAEVYKSFLYCAAKLIREQSGEITAYDGDRVMAVFIGADAASNAVRTALKLNYTRTHVLQPTFNKLYPDKKYTFRHKCGVDMSSLFVARTGIRGANDLVWVGRAANYAAKLCELSADVPTRITPAVHAALPDKLRRGNNGSVWTSSGWAEMRNIEILESTAYISF